MYNVGAVFTMDVTGVLSLLTEALNLAQVFLAHLQVFFFFLSFFFFLTMYCGKVGTQHGGDGTGGNETFEQNKPDAPLCTCKYSWALPWERVAKLGKPFCLLLGFFHLALARPRPE